MPDTLLDEPAPNGPMPPRLPGVSTICCLLPSARTEVQDYTWMTIESRRRGAQSRRNILARSEVAAAMRLRVRKRSKRAVFIYSIEARRRMDMRARHRVAIPMPERSARYSAICVLAAQADADRGEGSMEADVLAVVSVEAGVHRAE